MVEILMTAVLTERRAAREALARYERSHAPRFNIFNVVGNHETLLSGVIGWMLDKHGSHGQGSAFLKLFLEQFCAVLPGGHCWTDEAVGRLCVAMEVQTRNATGHEGRRMDILLEGGGVAIVIENKPYAGWQPGQLDSYWREVAGSRRRLLAFVGGTEDAQTEVERHWRETRRDTQRAARFPGVSSIAGYDYGAFADWADECAGHARPESVSRFLRDLAEFGRSLSRGDLSMEEIDGLARVVLQSPEHIEAGLEIEAAMASLRDRLAEQLVQPLQKALPKWTVSADVDHADSMSGVSATPPGAPDGIYFYLYGRSTWQAWVAIPKGEATRFIGDARGKAGGKWAWWRLLTEAELGVDPTKAWAMTPDALAKPLARIARACAKPGKVNVASR